MNARIQDVRSDYHGFEQLIAFAAETQDAVFENVDVDILGWFDANMCAPLGALMYRLSRQANTVRVGKTSSAASTILSKNGFLSNYGRERVLDTHRTTIQYQRFEPKDDRYFADYIAGELPKKELPRMSSGLLRRLQESLYEIFSNAVIHSETQLGIFACGQFFPNRHRLDFTIVDLGIGIRENVRRNTGLNFSASRAIAWAMEGKNTTKRGRIPGGLGLKLLREFIEKNDGRIQIVSDRGYWEFSDKQIVQSEFSAEFPGTAVNIEFNMMDTKSYRLSSEIRPEDIF